MFQIILVPERPVVIVERPRLPTLSPKHLVGLVMFQLSENNLDRQFPDRPATFQIIPQPLIYTR